MDGTSFLPVLLGESQEHKRYTFGLHTTRGIINGSNNFGIRSCGTKTHRYIRNLNPEVTFTNAVTKVKDNPENFWSSWLEAAENGNAFAKAMTEKYQHRPSEELYDVVNDPHCLKNLADDPELAAIKSELSAQLSDWMESQGDKGVETESLALTRLVRNANNQKEAGQKKGGKRKAKQQ